MSSQKQAEQLDQEGKCLICGTVTDGRRRGLCISHYERFRRARAKIPEDRVAEFKAVLIEKGHLLASRQGQKDREEDVFAEAAVEFMATTVDPKDAEAMLELEKKTDKALNQPDGAKKIAAAAVEQLKAAKRKKAAKKKQPKE